MIVEERDYRAKPGKTAQFVTLYEQYGLPIQLACLGEFLGYFITEVGDLNHIVAWWRYASLDDRLVRREHMAALPEWKSYVERVDGMLDHQTSRFLKPTSFSPIK